jgi:hypothetical protein
VEGVTEGRPDAGRDVAPAGCFVRLQALSAMCDRLLELPTTPEQQMERCVSHKSHVKILILI